jgi:hypothetical protein
VSFVVVVSFETPLAEIEEVETEGDTLVVFVPDTLVVFVPDTLCIVLVRGLFDEFSNFSRSTATRTNSEEVTSHSHF